MILMLGDSVNLTLCLQNPYVIKWLSLALAPRSLMHLVRLMQPLNVAALLEGSCLSTVPVLWSSYSCHLISVALPKSLLSQHDSTSCLLVMLSQYSDGEVCGPQCFGHSQGFCVLHLLFPWMSSWCAVAHSVLLKDSCFLCSAGSLYFCCYCCMSKNLILCLWMYLKGVMLHFLYAGLFVFCSLITHIQQLFWYNL